MIDESLVQQVVREVLKSLGRPAPAAEPVAAAGDRLDPARDYPLATQRPELVRTPGGRRLEEGEGYRLLDLFAGEGSELATLYDEFALASGIAPAAPRPRTAWLSWYYYYTRVSAEEIRRVLAGLKRLDLPLDFFLIDDGYEVAVGDWLAPSARFPAGPAPLAEEIRAAGYIPGIWVAPFVAERRSILWRDHPHWFLRGPDGRPLPAGMNPNWSGPFFALDLSRPEPREYVREVIRAMTAWGFSLLKLDFLYAACLRPTPRRTRGELMAEAIELVRAAAALGLPRFVVCTTAKFLPSDYLLDPCLRAGDPEEIMPVSNKNITVRNIYFDLTPLDLVSAVITEEGALEPASLRERLAPLQVYPGLRGKRVG